MTTSLRTLIVAVFNVTVLAACVAAPPTPTPTAIPTPTLTSTPMPTPTLMPKRLVPELVGRWVLDRVIEYGIEKPAFGYGLTFEFSQWIRFKGDRSFAGYDGCNEFWGRFTFDRSGGLNVGGEEGELMRTVQGCPVVIDVETGEIKTQTGPLADEYYRAVLSVLTYDIRAEELWLYYSADKSHALVFQRADETD